MASLHTLHGAAYALPPVCCCCIMWTGELLADERCEGCCCCCCVGLPAGGEVRPSPPKAKGSIARARGRGADQICADGKDGCAMCVGRGEAAFSSASASAISCLIISGPCTRNCSSAAPLLPSPSLLSPIYIVLSAACPACRCSASRRRRRRWQHSQMRSVHSSTLTTAAATSTAVLACELPTNGSMGMKLACILDYGQTLRTRGSVAWFVQPSESDTWCCSAFGAV